MKQFRYLVVTAVVSLTTLSLVMFSSCKNKCGSTTCQNGGTCESNKCVCPKGYSGNSCQSGWVDVVIGTYKCQRSDCKPAVTGTNSWQSAITKDATNGGFTVDISNFNNSNITVVATVDSNIGGVSKIRIAPVTGPYGVDASGTYSNGVIQLTFTTVGTGGVVPYNCSMVMTKQ